MTTTAGSRIDIFERLRNHRKKLSALGVERIGVFGSFARGEQDRDSDVDLLVHFADGRKTFASFMQVAFLLEEILDRPVETVTPEALSPHTRPRILNEVRYADLDD